MKIGILGASGNVGRCVVRHLLSYDPDVVERVVLVHRREIGPGVLPKGDDRLHQHVVDMSSGDELERACATILEPVDAVVATMGIGSGKGSAAAFRRVEVELPTAFARAAKVAGARRAVLLTSAGADIDSTSSWIVGGAAEGKFFHFKGLVEKNFADLGFVDGLAIMRPAGLLGTSHVPAWLDWLLPKLDWLAPGRFRSIHIDKLAYAIARAAVQTPMITREGSGGGSGEGSGEVAIFEGKALFMLFAGSRHRPGSS